MTNVLMSLPMIFCAGAYWKPSDWSPRISSESHPSLGALSLHPRQGPCSHQPWHQILLQTALAFFIHASCGPWGDILACLVQHLPQLMLLRAV